MKIKERIKIVHEGKDKEKLKEILLSQNYKFEEDNFKFILDYTFQKGRFEKLKYILEKCKLEPKVFHSIFPVYERIDYKKAELFEVYFCKQLWIDEPSFEIECSSCKQKKVKIDFGFQISKIKSKEDTLIVNGEFKIVSIKVKEKIIANNLKGAEFHPFDKQGKYFYISASSDLDNLMIHEEEVIGYKGSCEKCGNPIFDVFAGPLRYKRESWNGDDFVRSSFADDILFSKDAVELLRRYNKAIITNPVFLE